ncbi:fungal pheromone mating factor STE2 GPCR-domain-containing protein [Aspergillus cavernicola]|uniref:Fungal pheromone mating factor STE2 GPCR-domain-containing protein n=1 Tax=Aspergillus cavernicola TaxID=176166 RepID=A0ABR4ICK2_9EURO
MASKFDPWTQNVIFHDADGNPIEVPIGLVDAFAQYPVRICINYGAQLGASIILLLILLLLTKSEKRSSYVFYLNCLALLLNVGRLICSAVVFTSPWTRAYAFFAHDYSRVPASAYANSILGVIFGALLLTAIEISLVNQVQVVCANLRRIYRRALFGASIIIGIIPVAFRYWLAVQNIKNIIHAADPVPLNGLESTCNILLTVSVCFFCAVFVTKLGFAIRLRRELGLTDFGPMKAIFIMGCQTMVIPAIFSIMHYFVDIPELSTNVMTLVTLSLPLSSIWAGTTLGKPSNTAPDRNFWQVLSFSGRDRQSSTSTSSTATKSCTKCYSDAQPLTEKELRSTDTSALTKYGIEVEHDISVHSARRDSFGEV